MCDEPPHCANAVRRLAAATLLCAGALAACDSSRSPAPAASAASAALPATAQRSPASSSPPARSFTVAPRRRITTPTSALTAPTASPSTAPVIRRRPPSASPVVIVVDPGHSPSVQGTDPGTGLNVSDYENEPEMIDVFRVAVLVRSRLEADGYRVVMTKNSVADRVTLGQRAAIANNAHAALAVSIHDQGGSSGGIDFQQGNNIVYYQSVGDYRVTPDGTRIRFTDSRIAAISQRFGRIFQARRSVVEGHAVRLQGDVGYDLGSRGLPAGNIWLVQLLSKVPWIYNESGGNSDGLSGLDATDRNKYANGLVSSIEKCVPIVR